MADCRINPLGDRVVILPDKRPSETASGIILPESTEPATTGTIVRAGADLKIIAPRLRAGARVVFARYGGNPIAVDGVDFVVMTADDVLGTLDAPVSEHTERVKAIVAEIPEDKLVDMSDEDVALYVRTRMEADSEGGDGGD